MRPPEDPLTAPEPWTLTPDTWVPAEPLPFVLVAPHNKTLPGGFGPAPDMDGLWSDWNPRYARDGDSPQYQTPPPRFESFLVEELLPFVDHLLPVGRSRGYRATVGGSQGGFGALKYALQHPDLFAASGSISGGSLPLGRYLKPASPVGIQPPLDVPYVQLPGVTPSLEYPPESNYLVIPSIMPAYGDPVADHTYWEGEMPSGIASNGRAFLDGRQAVAFRLTVGDAIPRRPQDVNVGLEGYEILTHITTREMARAFDLEELGYELLIRPGHHGEPYISPYHRLMVEFLWRNMRHPDGSGIEMDRPERFDYRTIRTSVSIWGWAFSVERQPTEWLNLTSVGCDGLTLRGTGVVQVTVPAFCGTGLDGSTTFAIDLGPDQATDQPAHVGHYDVYGATRTITLTPL
jgi:pimeloyl-ACP methyl ester carboxylesterase